MLDETLRIPWSGSFVFGQSYAAYFGLPDDNELHQHAAIQIVLDVHENATILNNAGDEITRACCLIRPLVTHAIASSKPITLLYVEPNSALAVLLLENVGEDDICELPLSVLPFAVSSQPKEIVRALDDSSNTTTPNLDKRLSLALDDLRENPGSLTIKEVAARCGLSESRLRSIARAQFGVPLSTWLIWRKLESAAVAISQGANLADAAAAGGFSDQAHFCRAMRRMFGVTPKVAANSLQHPHTH